MKIKKIYPIFFFLFCLAIMSQFIYSLRGILQSTPIDFLHYYLASKGYLLGENPYNFVPKHTLSNGMVIVFNYPPTSLLLFWLLAIFPLKIIRILWEIGIFLALLSSVYIIFKILKTKVNPYNYLFTICCFLLSFPIRHTFGMGQISIFIGLLLMLSFYFSIKEPGIKKNLGIYNEILSGFFLSLAISLKVFPLIFLIYFLFSKRFKIIVFTFFFLFANFLISWFMVGNHGWKIYLSLSPFPDIFLSRKHYYEQSISAFFARLSVGYEIKVFLFWITEIVLFLLTIYQTIINHKKNKPLVFSLYFILSSIALGFNWQHYFSLLIFSYLVIGHHIYGIINSKNIASSSKTFHLLFVIMVISYLLVSFNLKNPDLIVNQTGKFKIVILSHGLYGALILYLLNLYLLIKTNKLF